MARPQKAQQLQHAAMPTGEPGLVNPDGVRAARAGLPAVGCLEPLRELFAALGDVTRLRIVAALLERELCVRDLAAVVGTSESAVSHHLSSMRRLGLVRFRREGRLAYYALDDEHVAALYQQGSDHVAHRLEEVAR